MAIGYGGTNKPDPDSPEVKWYNFFSKFHTIDGAAELIGYKSYDTAVPQDWADTVRNLTGIYPVGHVVWCYDGKTMLGNPAPVTSVGFELMKVIPEKLGGLGY